MEAPRITVDINGAQVAAALDTCASCNFISRKLVKKYSPQKSTILLANEEGTTTAMGTWEGKITIDDQEYIEKFLVVPNLREEIILGHTWLTANKVTMDYGQRCIHHGLQPRVTTFWLGTTKTNKVSDNPQVTHEFPPPSAKTFEKLLSDFSAVVNADSVTGTVRAVQHTIRLKDTKPFRVRPYQVNETKRQQMYQCIEEMLATGVIERSNSEYCSPAVLVKKSDGSVRFCTDYRKLNQATIDETAVLPKIQDALKDFGSAQIFSALDLKSGYWQIPLDNKSKHLTAFATPDGSTYQYKVMPFGLKNAPASFQKLMNQVLAGTLGKYTHVYLDDIIVYSKTYDEHLIHLRIVFERLQEFGLKCASEKCKFGVKEIKYLGHIITHDGNQPQQKHLTQILNAPPPKNKKEVRKFLGLATWVREYVPKFAELAAPLTDLLNLKKKFQWRAEEEEAFNKLKTTISQPLKLHRPDFTQRFTLQTDASGVGIAAVLLQEDKDKNRKVISYGSARLTDTQKRWHINELECFAIVWAVKRYRPYLENREFTLKTDNKALLWLNSAKDSTAKLTRYAIVLQEFKFIVEHCAGKDNELPDLLSRDPDVQLVPDSLDEPEKMFAPVKCGEKVETMYMTQPQSFLEEIMKKQREDPQLELAKERLKKIGENGATEPGEAAFRNHYEIRNGQLWNKTHNQLWVPENAQKRVLFEFHDSLEANHPGRDETIRAIKTQFTWPNLHKNVVDYVASCLICSTMKRPTPQASAPLRAYIPKKPWETIAIDFMGPYEETPSGNRFLLVVTDLFSRWIEAFPTSNETTKVTVQILEKEIFSRWGYPKALISDNGPQFTSTTFQQACKKWKVIHWPTPIYHPQANPTERRNQEIKKVLRILSAARPNQSWDEILHKGLFSIRNRQNSATGQTPSYTLFGYDIQRPGHWKEEEEEITPSKERQQQVRESQTKYQKRYADKGEPPIQYTIGDEVMVKRHIKSGFKSTWVGPYTITKVNGENCYTVDRGSYQTREHVNNIRKARVNQKLRQNEAGTQREEGDEVPVQAIIGTLMPNEAPPPYRNEDLHRIRQRQIDRLNRPSRSQQRPRMESQTPQTAVETTTAKGETQQPRIRSFTCE